MRAPSARNSKVLGNMNARTPGHETKIVKGSGAHLVPMVLVAAPHDKLRADAARFLPSYFGGFTQWVAAKLLVCESAQSRSNGMHARFSGPGASQRILTVRLWSDTIGSGPGCDLGAKSAG